MHAFQATGSGFFAAVARDIVRWMDEWRSDREHGGFYGFQDADYSHAFPWCTTSPGHSRIRRPSSTEQELAVASLHYDIKEIGEMHHDPAKNVLYFCYSIEDVA